MKRHEKTMNTNSEKAMKNEKPAKSGLCKKRTKKQVFAILRPNVLKSVPAIYVLVLLCGMFESIEGMVLF